MPDDAALLRRYAEDRAEDAFAAVVQRHLDGVYSAALRRVGGDVHLAEDVAQEVFAALASQAGRLSRHPVLTAWLYTTTRNIAGQKVRTERRRKAREREAQVMHEILSKAAAETDWKQIGPLLDGLIDELGERDRTAVLLRFIERRAFAEIGTMMRLSEAGAGKRVDRALDKLRKLLARRGIISSSSALAAMLSEQVVSAAPAGLASVVTSTVLAGAAAGTGGAAGLQIFLAMNKIKIGIAGIVFVAAMMTGIMELKTHRALGAELDVLRAGRETPPEPRVGLPAQSVDREQPRPNSEAEELARLRERASLLRTRPDGIVDSEMKSREVWKNSGHATPEAAMETLVWASLSGDLDTLAKSYAFSEATKAKADAFFASLDETVRARYGTPERLFAPLLAVGFNHVAPVAYQVSEEVDPGPDTVVLRLWTRSPTGAEHDAGTMPFVREGTNWKFGRIGFDLDLSRIDPATGEFIPGMKQPSGEGRQ